MIADATALPIRTGSVDLVLTSAPTDLSGEDRIAAFSEIARITKGRAVILANTPGERYVHGYDYPATGEVYVRVQIALNSAPGDTVYDPFAGTGTIPRMANLMERHGLGSDIR